MGLGGRKEKQRIGADPRNLTWADDAAKFGQAYLAKLGWDPSRGLGASGDGRTSHIKVAQKLNLLGIGAGASKELGDQSIAWKQNREYEMLLKRLNEGLEAEQKEEEGHEEVETGKDEVKERKKRKREEVTEAVAMDEDETETAKKDKKDRKEKKKARKDKAEKRSKKNEDKNATATEIKPDPIESASSIISIQAPVPRPMAHRARFLRSKKLASRSSTAIAEILGIPSSTTNSAGPSSVATTPFPPSSESTTPAPDQQSNELRTATTSVADYFKEKLAARALSRGRSSDPSSSLSSTSAPTPDSTAVLRDVAHMSIAEREPDAPRAGIGSKIIDSDTVGCSDGSAPRIGVGANFGGLMGGFSMPSSVSASKCDLQDSGEQQLMSPKTVKFECGDPPPSKKEGKKRKTKEKKNSAESSMSPNEVPKSAVDDVDEATDNSAKEKSRVEKSKRKNGKVKEKERKTHGER